MTGDAVTLWGSLEVGRLLRRSAETALRVSAHACGLSPVFEKVSGRLFTVHLLVTVRGDRETVIAWWTGVRRLCEKWDIDE